MTTRSTRLRFAAYGVLLLGVALFFVGLPPYGKDRALNALALRNVPISGNSLIRAIVMNDGSTVKLLLQAGVSANAETENRYDRPLIRAIQQCRPLIVSLLVDAGAEVTARDQFNNSVLHLVAVSCIDPNAAAHLADMLIKAGADVNAINRDGSTPLLLAVRSGSATLVRVLCNAGADPRRADLNGQTPIRLAARSTGVAAMSMLSDMWRAMPSEEGGAVSDIERARLQLGRLGVPPTADSLVDAASKGRAHLVELLLRAGVDPNIPRKAGSEPHNALTAAILGSHVDVVQILLKRGTTPRSDDISLVLAKHLQAVAEVLFDGPYVDHGDLLILCSQRGWEPMVRFLLARGADPHRTDSSGNTALHIACRLPTAKTDSTIPGLLLDAGAEIEARNLEHRTPLMEAVATGATAVVALLLDRGADPTARSYACTEVMHLLPRLEMEAPPDRRPVIHWKSAKERAAREKKTKPVQSRHELDDPDSLGFPELVEKQRVEDRKRLAEIIEASFRRWPIDRQLAAARKELDAVDAGRRLGQFRVRLWPPKPVTHSRLIEEARKRFECFGLGATFVRQVDFVSPDGEKVASARYRPPLEWEFHPVK